MQDGTNQIEGTDQILVMLSPVAIGFAFPKHHVQQSRECGDEAHSGLVRISSRMVCGGLAHVQERGPSTEVLVGLLLAGRGGVARKIDRGRRDRYIEMLSRRMCCRWGRDG